MNSIGIIVIVDHSRAHNRNRNSSTDHRCKYTSKAHVHRIKAIFCFKFLTFLWEKVRVHSHLRTVKLEVLCELFVVNELTVLSGHVHSRV